MKCLIPEYLGLLNEKDQKTICYFTFTYETTAFQMFLLETTLVKLSLPELILTVTTEPAF